MKIPKILQGFGGLVAAVGICYTICAVMCLVPNEAPFTTATPCPIHGVSRLDGVPVYVLSPLVWNFPVSAKQGYAVKCDGETAQTMSVPISLQTANKYAEIVEVSTNRIVARVYVQFH